MVVSVAAGRTGIPSGAGLMAVRVAACRTGISSGAGLMAVGVAAGRTGGHQEQDSWPSGWPQV
jgi:hypothetical protein